VSRIVLLDAGPLGLVTNPKVSPQGVACVEWLQALLAGGDEVLVPEIADYEGRRELLRAEKIRCFARLDEFIGALRYLPITTPAMRQAAAFWAQARQAGLPTAADVALDADAILAGQAATLGAEGVVVATTNVGHLGRFVEAALWSTVRAN
jgi:predicted nucleic acid-binding protein